MPYMAHDILNNIPIYTLKSFYVNKLSIRVALRMKKIEADVYRAGPQPGKNPRAVPKFDPRFLPAKPDLCSFLPAGIQHVQIIYPASAAKSIAAESDSTAEESVFSADERLKSRPSLCMALFLDIKYFLMPESFILRLFSKNVYILYN